MIDHEHLESLTQLIGKDTMDQIRLEFIDDSHEKMTQLLQAWEERNYDALRDISHSLKSASLNMALRRFAEQCQQVEMASIQHDEQAIQPIIHQLPALHQASLNALADLFT